MSHEEITEAAFEEYSIAGDATLAAGRAYIAAEEAFKKASAESDAKFVAYANAVLSEAEFNQITGE